MKIFVTFLICVSIVLGLKLVKVKTPTDPVLLEHLRNIDIHYSREENVVIVSDISELKDFEILHVQELGSVPSGYKTHDQIVDNLKKLEREHPLHAKVINVSQEFSKPSPRGNSIIGLKVSLNVHTELDLPNILIVASHHPREIINPEIILETVANVLKNPIYKEILEKNQIYFIPVLNVDGYKYLWEANRFWRKNLNGKGVDLNRNYSPGFSSTCGGSVNSTNTEYRGAHAESELEVQTLIRMSLNKRFAKVIDLHSRGRVVFCGYSKCLKRNLLIHNYIKQKGAWLAEFANYRAPGDAVAAGKHELFHYLYTTWFAFLVETYEGTDWQPEFSVARSEVNRVLPLVQNFLSHPIPLIGHVIDEKTGNPLSVTIEYVNLELLNGEMRTSDALFGKFYEFLPQGKYIINFSLNGYQDIVKSIQIVDGSTLSLKILMKSK